MKYKLAVFDMDGTILDTLEDLKNSLNYALAVSGLAPRSISEVRSFVGNGIRKLIERGVPQGTPPDITDKVHNDFTSYYDLHCGDNTKPYDGIPELLNRLHSCGMLIAVVSNKPDFAVQKLSRQYFGNLFDASVGERQGIERKPAPHSVNAVLSTLGVERRCAVYIGDSEVDIQTAKNAEMDCISVNWGFKTSLFLEDNGASVIVSSAEELYEQLK